jgi:uncharacterized protein
MPSSAEAERIGALDLIRGVAILGILPANIPWFSGTGSIGLASYTPPDSTFADQLVKGLTLAFVDSKFISQLAILFGAGLAVQAGRAWSSGRSFTVGYLWRTFLLFILGALHSLLLWNGDILMIYACISVAAVFFVRLRTRGMLTVAGLGLTWTAASITTVMVLASMFGGPSDKDKEKPPPGTFATPATISKTMSELINSPPETREEGGRRVEEEFKIYFSRDNQVRIYREGSYGEQVFDRIFGTIFLLVVLIFIYGELLACFMFGAILVRSGFFHDPEVYCRWRPWLLAVGLLIGVPMHVAVLILTFGGGNDTVTTAAQLCGGIAIALVYLTLLTGWEQSHRAEWLQRRLKAVGRLALTNYLSQTVICTTIFYSFGFGLYATLGRPETLLIVLAVWLVQLLISPVYLRFFSIGPVEWLWRSLSQLRMLPMRQRKSVVETSQSSEDVPVSTLADSETTDATKIDDPNSPRSES